ncbi:hypothetical protein K0M31_018149 [Melipona bicolor]|uniref:Uncharacterized protein n=1 Tax=Melipona bicolor TaxID=60889 RepID=A0AA40FD38_9HYME|nr:hypothetical protein K0M31_018149 [Melipona bicolor]
MAQEAAKKFGRNGTRAPRRRERRLTHACPVARSRDPPVVASFAQSQRKSCITYGDCVSVISSSDRANTTLAFSAGDTTEESRGACPDTACPLGGPAAPSD